MLQFLTVTKKYSTNIAALEEVSFDINEGEFVFLVGPSGSGKTTIIKLLIREELPSNGKIFFDNDDITRYNRGKIYKLRRKIGVIFQDFKLIPEMTAYENVAFAMEAAGRTEKEIKENVPYLLDIVGLSNRIRSFPHQLSGGEKQRVAIARAMANNPKLLIADEPTGNLDPDSAWDIVQILSKINNWGTTVVMSTHGSDIVNTLHKRVIRLENGQLVRDDFKGGYNIDDFSLKIISAQAEHDKKISEAISVKPTPTQDEKADTKLEKVDVKAEKQSNKLHQKKSDKKITFSTRKKTKKDSDVKEDKSDAPDSFESQILKTIADDINTEEKEDTTISEMKISKEAKDFLAEKKIITLVDLIQKKKEIFSKKSAESANAISPQVEKEIKSII